MSSNEVHEVVVSEYAQTLIRVKARQICRQPGFSRAEVEELEQELHLLLFTKLQQFDPSRSSLNTFIDRVVQSGVRMALRHARRHKRSQDRFTRSLDHEIGSGRKRPLHTCVSQDAHSRRTGRPQPTPIADFLDRDALLFAMESLPDELREICVLLMEVEPTPLAARLGMSRRQMKRSIEQIRAHFVRAGFGRTSDSRTRPNGSA